MMSKERIVLKNRLQPALWAGLLALGAFAFAACNKKQPGATQASTAAPAAAPVAAAAAPAVSKPAAPAPKPVETFAEASKGMKLARLLGIVESVRPSDGVVEVKSKSGALESFEVLSDSKLDAGRKDRSIALADLKSHERVRVVHAGKFVKSLHVLTLASAK